MITIPSSGWRPDAGRVFQMVLATVLLAVAGCATSDGTTQSTDMSEFVWPRPPEEPRIELVKIMSSEDDVGATEKLTIADALLGKNKTGGKRLSKPYGVHADRDGRIFVTDTGWGKVVMFDSENNKFEFWGTEGKGFLKKPIGITSDGEGRIYVSDVLQKRIIVFDADGEFVMAMGGENELQAPAGIALDEARGRLYVVDVKGHDIAVFDRDGRLIEKLGGRGGEPGQFNFPTNIAVGPDGRLYIMDTMNFRVQILEPDGRPVHAFGEVGDGLGRFARPKGIGLDSDGNIYVSDAAFSNFQVFNPEGKLLMFVGELGPAPGQFWLPAGLHIDKNDRIYVADQFNLRIQVFKYLGGVAGKDAALKTANGAAVQ